MARATMEGSIADFLLSHIEARIGPARYQGIADPMEWSRPSVKLPGAAARRARSGCKYAKKIVITTRRDEATARNSRRAAAERCSATRTRPDRTEATCRRRACRLRAFRS